MRRQEKYRVIVSILVFFAFVTTFFGYMRYNSQVFGFHRFDNYSPNYIFNEVLENWVGTGPVHYWIHHGYNSAPSYFYKKPPYVILNLHITRTTGHAIRYHLLRELDGQEYLGLDLSHCCRWKIASPYNITDIRKLKQYIYIKDFMSWGDVELFRVNNVSVKTYLVLRDPIERVLSIYKKYQTGYAHIPNTSKELDLESFFLSDNRYIKSNVVNSMTYQLATYKDIEFRGIGLKNRNPINNIINETEVLELAKKHLKQTDFVGYYELLLTDFDRLYYELFDGYLSCDWLNYQFFKIGTIGMWFRMRTRKYTDVLTEKELEIVKSVNKLDIELYEWSLKEFNKKFITFHNYQEAWPYIGLILIIVTAITVSCCYCCCICCKLSKKKIQIYNAYYNTKKEKIKV